MTNFTLDLGGAALTRASLSIVIINYNYGTFLPVSLESVLTQDYPCIEVIVVDDGSTDNSIEVLQKYKNRIRLVRQNNQGHVAAANSGFAASSGDVVIFLDADDLLYPHCVETVMRAWRPGLAKIQFRLDTIDERGIDQAMPFPVYGSALEAPEILRRVLLTGYYPWPVSSGNAFARSFLEQVTPIDQARIFKSPDGYWNKLAPLFGDVLSLDRVLGAYRVHGQNAWAQASQCVRSDIYAKGTKFDAVLHNAYVEVAQQRGYCVPEFDKAPVPQWLEVRLLSLRLSRNGHPFSQDHTLRVWWLGVRAAFLAPGIAGLGRVLWVAWFTLIATLPARLILELTGRWRPQAGRSKVAMRLVAFSRSFALAKPLRHYVRQRVSSRPSNHAMSIRHNSNAD